MKFSPNHKIAPQSVSDLCGWPGKSNELLKISNLTKTVCYVKRKKEGERNINVSV